MMNPVSPNLRHGDLRHLAAFALGTAAVAAIRPTVSYRALELGAGTGQIGLIGGAFAALALVAALPVGAMIDRRGERAFFLLGTGMIGLAAVADAWAAAVVVLPLAQALLGLGHLCMALATQTITARGPGRLIDNRFARMAVAASLGQFGGPLLAGWILDQPSGPAGLSPTVTVFLVATAISVLASAIVWPRGAWDQGRHHPSYSPPEMAAGGILGMVRVDGIKEAIFTSVSIVTAVDILIAYLPVLGEEIGLSPAFVGLVLALRAAAGVASRLVVGRLIGRFGRRLTLVGNVVMGGAAMAAIAWIGTEAVILALAVIIGFGLGLGQPITAAWVSSQAPPGRVSAALALRLSGNRLGQLVLPAAFGALAGLMGTPLVFLAAAGGLVGSALWVRTASLDG